MTFYTTHIDAAETLGLYGSDAQVYFALAYLAKHQPWRGSYRELARLSRCGKSKNTARATVELLIKRGLLVQTDEGLSVVKNRTEAVNNRTQAVNNRTNLKESNKENINNINKNSLSVCDTTARTDGQTDFLFETFWKNYSAVGGMRKYKRACVSVWKKMPENWRALAAERAKEHAAERNPYWWLKDEDFLRVDGGAQAAAEKPHWLSGVEQDDCLRGGIALAVCKNPETGLFGTVTKSDAEKFGLAIKRTL